MNAGGEPVRGRRQATDVVADATIAVVQDGDESAGRVVDFQADASGRGNGVRDDGVGCERVERDAKLRGQGSGVGDSAIEDGARMPMPETSSMIQPLSVPLLSDVKRQRS
jgi:hypothetical protein